MGVKTRMKLGRTPKEALEASKREDKLHYTNYWKNYYDEKYGQANNYTNAFLTKLVKDEGL